MRFFQFFWHSGANPASFSSPSLNSTVQHLLVRLLKKVKSAFENPDPENLLTTFPPWSDDLSACSSSKSQRLSLPSLSSLRVRCAVSPVATPSHYCSASSPWLRRQQGRGPRPCAGRSWWTRCSLSVEIEAFISVSAPFYLFIKVGSMRPRALHLQRCSLIKQQPVWHPVLIF